MPVLGFDRYPAFNLIRDYKAFDEGEVAIHMIPFFNEKVTYPHYLKKAVQDASEFPDMQNILITHVAVNGVTNNDGSDVENDLTSKVFKCFDKVLVGHYHNKQTIGNVHYVGSTHQHNFGEDENKGLTVIYDDCSIEQVRLDVPVYKTNKIDLNTISEDELEQSLKQIKSSNNFEKIKFSGTKEKLAAFDKMTKSLETQGVKIDRSVDDPEIDISYTELIEFKGFDNQSILIEWDGFAEKKELDKDINKQSKERLQKILNSDE